MDTVSQPSSSPESRLHFLDYWRVIRVRKLIILAVFLLVVATTTVVTLWLPKTYAATARIQIEKDNTDIPGLTERNPHQPFDFYYIQTQFERIQSELVLHKVIEDLKLHERWARRYGLAEPYTLPETFDLLVERRMDLRQVRNTSLVDIRVFSEDPEEAAEVANKIAEVYLSHRADSLERKTEGGLKSLLKRRDELSLIVSNLSQRVDRLREECGITDQLAITDQYVSSIDAEVVRRKEALQSEARREYLTLDNKVIEIRKMSPEQRRHGITAFQPDQPLAFQLQTLSLAEQNLASKRETLGEDHDEVKKALAEYNVASQQVDQRVEGIVEGLERALSAAKNTYEALVRDLEEAKQKDQEMQARSRPYYETKQDLAKQRKILDALDYRIEDEGVVQDLPKTMVEIITSAVPSKKPVFPKLALNIAAAVIVGLLAGIGLAFFIEYLDTSVKTIDDIEAVLQSPVVSVIPQNVGSLLEEGPESPHAEAYRVLRTNILFSRRSDSLNVLTAVSGGAAEGKSTTLFNLAVVFAQNGNRVLIVDSDLRRPSLHKLFGVSNSVGLTNVLLKQCTLEEAIQTSKQPGLDFLPSGRLPSSSLGILNSPHFHEFVQDIKRRYDFVLLDSPPVLGVSDASFLIRESDMALLVVQHRKYPQAMNVRARQTIDKYGGNLLGVVLNNINLSADTYYYYYGGYGYGYTNQNEEPPAKGKANGAAKPEAEGADKVTLRQKY
jgi:polysaccharide biosynthesis transport protein